MTVGLTQLIEDAEAIRETLIDSVAIGYKYGFIKHNNPDEDEDVQRIDRILAYFKERYVPPSEPGSYKDARGALEAMNDVIRRHNKPAL